VSEVGAWNESLFQSFRAEPPGPRRRRLLSELIRINEPLVKQLVGQVSGLSDDKRFAGKRKVKGAESVDWEDLMQAGRIGIQYALEHLDPSKGKISGFARWRIYYEVQELFRRTHFVKTPRGKEAERPAVSFHDEQEALDRLSLERCETVFEAEGVTQAQIAECARSGDWPDTPAAWQARFGAPRKVAVVVPIALPLDAMTAFLRGSCTAATAGRVATYDLWSAYVRHCRRVGEKEKPRPELVRAAAARFRGRQVFIRTHHSPSVRAITSFRLQCAES
jgi:hypothetical protein